MTARVAVVGIGQADIRATTPGISYKELMFEAATRAYLDAGVDPRRDVDSFVSCSEDYWTGTSIFDEYVPDQLGAILKPVHTIAGDGIQGLLAGAMLIMTQQTGLVAIEAHSKQSNVLTPERVLASAYDPVHVQPLGLNPHFLAGLEMRRYLANSELNHEDCARIVCQNRLNAIRNPAAAHGAVLRLRDVQDAEPVAAPLGIHDVASPADGGFVVVLASAERARGLSRQPIWLRGGGWVSDSYAIEGRDFGRAEYARLAAERAYAQAGIVEPRRDINLAEVDDTYSYKELMHLEALGFGRRGEMADLVRSGHFGPNGELPVNVSGGSLGVGHLLEASGLQRVHEIVTQLRGEAGSRQVKHARTGLAMSWRGVPTATGAVAIFSN